MGALKRHNQLLILQTLMFAAFFMLTPLPAHAQDVTTGLVGHWKLDETAGTTANDSAGSNNGTMQNGLSAATDSVNGKIRTALNFDGTDDYFNTTNIFASEPSGISVSAWIYPESYGEGNEGIIATIHDGAQENFQIRLLNGSGEQSIRVFSRTGSVSDANAANNSITLNEWQHIAVTQDFGTAPKIYRNGIELSYASTLAGNAVTALASDSLRVGANLVPIRRFEGSIDDIRIYNRALTAADIAVLASSFPGPVTCNAAYEAVMWYNNDENVMQYCNGTDWIDMGPHGSYNHPVNGLLAHWPLDETSGATIADLSGNSHDGAWFDGSGNDVSDDTVAGRVGTALDFNGTTDRVQITPASGSPFDIDQFTLSAWVQLSSLASGEVRRIMMRRDGSYGIFKRSDDHLAVLASTTDVGGSALQATTPSPLTAADLNTWIMVTGTYDGANIRLYIDGAEVDSIAQTGLVNDPVATTFAIGQNTDGTAGSRWPGLIDHALLYNRALSPEEIQDLYRQGGGQIASTCTSPAGIAGEVDYNFTDGTMQYCNGANWIAMGPKIAGAGGTGFTYTAPTTNLVGHWPLDETGNTSTATDATGANDGTLTSFPADPTPSWVTGQVSGGLDFDGTDDYVHMGNVSLVSQSMTVAGWIYIDTLTENPTILSKYDGSDPNREFWLRVTGAGAAELRVSDDGTSGAGSMVTVTSTTNLSTGQWYHLAGTFDHSTGTAEIYINGSLNNTATDAGVTGVHNGGGDPLRIGRTDSSGVQNTDGVVDDVRIYDTALSAEDVYSLYRATGGTGTGLVGHWTLDDTNTTALDSAGSNDGSMGGGLDGATDSVAGQIGSALDFDGTDDVIAFPSTVTDGLSAFTASIWIKTTESGSSGTYTNRPAFFGNETCCDASDDFILQTDAGNIAYFQGLDTTDRIFVSTTPINDDLWHHVALTYDGTQTDLYVDGAFVTGSTLTADGSALNNAASGIGDWDGGGSTHPHQGTLDDARIYNRALSAAEIADLYAGAGTNNTPTGCSNIGDVCSDGSVYAGLSPDGNVAMYTTPSDAGQFAWNNGNSSNYVNTTMADCTDGPPGTAGSCQTGAANTALLIAEDSDSGTGGTQPHIAAQHCHDLTAHSHLDWYLPAEDELDVLYTNRVAIGNFQTSGELYWSSSEFGNNSARRINFNTGFNTGGVAKEDATLYVRCVRKGSDLPGGTCSSPAGVAGEMVYNDANNIMQYCNGSEWVGIR